MGDLLGYEDYKKVLNYYNISIPKTRLKIKNMAEEVLAEKLCRCIKKVKKNSRMVENRAIGVCRNSVIHQKKLNIYQFDCRKKSQLRNFKNKSYKLKKRKQTNKTKKKKNKKN